MTEERTVAVDTETTGIGPEFHRLLEIAALEFDPDTGAIAEPFHRVIDPQRDVPEEAAKVHGWTNDKLVGKPLFADVADDFLAFCTGAHVVIHNAPFDVGFLDTELERAGKPKLTSVALSVTDTLKVSRTWVKAPSHTLDSLCDRFGVDKTKRVLHGALVDCELLAAVYPHVMAAARRMEELLNQILPRPMGAELPDNLHEAVLMHLALEDIKKNIDREQKRYTELVRDLVEGLPREGDGWEVNFSNRTTTDWEKIKKKYLEGVDLKEFQKASAAMQIRRA
jgi:DNA polymerase III subunit epsilon